MYKNGLLLLQLIRRISTRELARDYLDRDLSGHLESVVGGSGRTGSLARGVLRLREELHDLQLLASESKGEMEKLALSDAAQLRARLEGSTAEYLESLVTREHEGVEEVLFEVSAGVGGQEAMLFTKDLFDLYSNYCDHQGFQFDVISFDGTGIGGLRRGTLQIRAAGVYGHLFPESGVHRVQRVPKTEKQGRIHTSTSSVSILPVRNVTDVDLNEKDLKIETRRSSGAGGQNVNKTESAVRVTHMPSGLVVDCQTERSQVQNRSSALKILRSRLADLEEERLEGASRRDRKSQVGGSGRNEKIRTINFMQDRVTDHRVGVNAFDLKNWFEGGKEFEAFLDGVRKGLVEISVARFVSSLGGS